MRTTLLRWLLAALPLAIAAPLPVQAQDAPAAAEAPLSTQQLDQLLAPIALYPDGLLAQVLMAATYPLEVVEAARWVKANPEIKGDAAVKACEDKGWDVSVQSLVAFPQAITDDERQARMDPGPGQCHAGRSRRTSWIRCSACAPWRRRPERWNRTSSRR